MIMLLILIIWLSAGMVFGMWLGGVLAKRDEGR